MAYSDPARKFAKELPGADNVFQPPDIADYEDDAWDVRISVGDAPLEEAYYFTIEDPAAVRLTIGDVLTRALDPEQKSNLDIEEYPDLPFLQEELIQYRANEHQGLLKLEYYINHDPSGGPVNMWQTARDFIGVCTYHDGSHDYRVLDIIMAPVIPQVNDYELDRMRRLHGGTFLLMLLDYMLEQGDEAFSDFLASEPAAAYLSTFGDMTYRKFIDGMKTIEREGLIAKQTVEGDPDAQTIAITEAGDEKLEELKSRFTRDADYYNQFDSVSITPPALGVPGGFDVRVQMMEYDKVDIEATLLLQILGQDRDQWFAADQWSEAYESFSVFHLATEALSYKTNFSAEIMDALKTLGGDVT
jgi:hypothetical protein